MNIRRTTKQDLTTFADWFEKHGQDRRQSEYLSDIGYMVEGIAAAFLYTTNSKVCWIESYISNPDTNKNERKHALDFITEAIIQHAKELQFEAMICFIDGKATYERCINYGFVPGSQKIIFTKRI
ncbi:MAG: hypothetical protein KDB74_01455 [Flavobacteriales bacterium]|nr:hypothetical protein [Flavobacteriales bacterium]